MSAPLVTLLVTMLVSFDRFIVFPFSLFFWKRSRYKVEENSFSNYFLKASKQQNQRFTSCKACKNALKEYKNTYKELEKGRKVPP